MALRETTVRVTFQGGVETKSDSKSVLPSKLLALQNATFSKAISLGKRFGYSNLGTTVLGSTSPYGDPRGLAARGNELALFTEGGTSYSYVEGAAAWSEIPDGVMSLKQSDRTIIKTVSNQEACDYAEVDGIALVCWEDSRGGVYAAVMEADGGRVTSAPTQYSATGASPRAVRSGAKLLLLWSEAALGQIHVVVVDPSQPHDPSTSTVLIDDLMVAVPTYDAAFVNEDNSETRAAACITWNAVSGVRVGWLTPAGTVGTVGQGYPSPATYVPAAAVTAGPTIRPVTSWGLVSTQWVVVWATAANSYLATALSDLSSPVDPVAVFLLTALGVAGVDAMTVCDTRTYDAFTGAAYFVEVWLENRAATVRNSTVQHITVNVSTVGTSTETIRGAVLASKAWSDPAISTAQVTDAIASRGYVTLLHPTPLQSTYLTVRDDGLCVAQSIPGNAGDPPGASLPSVADEDGDRVYRWAAVYKGKLDALGNDVFTESGPRLVSLDFAATDAYQTAYVGRTLYLAGAVTMAYDGVSWVEALPHYAPDWESGATLHTSSGAGAGGMANGVYTYLFWYEATLANGEIIRGPASKPYEVTVAGADDLVTIEVPTLRLSAWGRAGGSRENLRLCAARSQAGDASTYYRVTSMDPSATGANGYVSNTQSADTVTVTDEYSDATLATKEPHYTTGDVPSNDAIATAGIIAEGKGRVFLASASDPNAVYFSQEQAEGYSVELSPSLRIVTPPAGGAVTGLAVMDDKVIIFKRTAIYMVSGPGPLPNPAAGGEWSTPALITSDVGCIDQRTIVTTPTGVMFQTAKGIYQLDRGLQVAYVGAAVERYNSQRITRATLIEDSTQVRFLTDDGSTLLYDYLFGQWSTFTQHEGLDSVIIAGTYHYLRTDGRVFKQAATYADDNLDVPMVIETAWIRLGEARQGFQRIWHAQILGEWKSAHVLRVQWMTDYTVDGNWSQPIDLDATTMGGGNYGDGNYGDGDYGGDAPEPYQFKVHVGEKCQSIRFRFSFIEAAGVRGACAELTELLLTGGVKGSLNKLPASRMG